MTNCNTNPTSGCTENKNSIQIKKTIIKLDPKLTLIESTLDEMKIALENLCTDEGANLDIIKVKLDTILANNIECCEAINEQLENIAEVLEQFDIAVTTTTTTAIPTTTTTTNPYPCFNYLLENIGGEGDVASFLVIYCNNDAVLQIELAFGETLTDCFKIVSANDAFGAITNLGECTTTTTTCLDCTTTTSTTVEPTTTTTTALPEQGKIYYTIGAGVTCNLKISNSDGEIINKNSLYGVVQTGVISGYTGVITIIGSWVSGSGNIIHMRICDGSGQLYYDDPIEGPVTNANPSNEFVTSAFPYANAPVYVYITNHNTVPPTCPVP